jgi:hypothetical protein
MSLTCGEQSIGIDSMQLCTSLHLMDDFTLFYAWQSDHDPKANRYLIRDAAHLAIKELASGAIIEEAPRLDADTQRVAGTPEVAATIFSKIDRSGLFLADVSFVGKSVDNDALPNSNVLIELGYAAARIGWSRIILVMNTAFGTPDKLVFDLRHRRWPIVYHLETTEKSDIKEQRSRLAAELKAAIISAASQEHTEVLNMIEKLDLHCLGWMSSLGNHDAFQPPHRQTAGEILGHHAIDAALIRLLELGILRSDLNPAEDKHAYHWTYLGKLVLYHLGMRTRPKTG